MTSSSSSSSNAHIVIYMAVWEQNFRLRTIWNCSIPAPFRNHLDTCLLRRMRPVTPKVVEIYDD